VKLIDCPKCGGKGKIEDPRWRSEELLKKMHRSGYSLRAIADKMGMSPPYLSDLTRGNRVVSPEMEARFNSALKRLKSKKKANHHAQNP